MEFIKQVTNDREMWKLFLNKLEKDSLPITILQILISYSISLILHSLLSI